MHRPVFHYYAVLAIFFAPIHSRAAETSAHASTPTDSAPVARRERTGDSTQLEKIRAMGYGELNSVVNTKDKSKKIDLDLAAEERDRLRNTPGASFLRDVMGFERDHAALFAHDITSKNPKDEPEESPFDVIFYAMMKVKDGNDYAKILDRIKSDLARAEQKSGHDPFFEKMNAAVDFMKKQMGAGNPAVSAPVGSGTKEEAAYARAWAGFNQKYVAMHYAFDQNGKWADAKGLLAAAWNQLPSGNVFHQWGEEDDLKKNYTEAERFRIMQTDVNKFLRQGGYYPGLQRSVKAGFDKYQTTVAAQNDLNAQFAKSDGALDTRKAVSTLSVANHYSPIEKGSDGYEKEGRFEKSIVNLMAPDGKLYLKPNPENPTFLSGLGIYSANPITVNVQYHDYGPISTANGKTPVTEATEMVKKLYQTGAAVPVSDDTYLASIPKRNERYWFDSDGSRVGLSPRALALKGGLREYDYDPKKGSFNNLTDIIVDTSSDYAKESLTPEVNAIKSALAAAAFQDAKDNGKSMYQTTLELLKRSQEFNSNVQLFESLAKPAAGWLIQQVIDPARN